MAGECRARLEYELRNDFDTDPPILGDADLADAFRRIKDIRSWCDSVEATALDRAYSGGRNLPGLKVVLTNGRRSIPDSATAIQTLIDHGFPAEKVADFKVKPLGKLERLVGKKELPAILGELITTSEGKPALVPNSDPRRAVSPEAGAAQDFE